MPTGTQHATTTFADNTVRHPADARTGATRCPDCTDGLGKPAPIEPGTFRAKMHATRATAVAWRVGVFVAGLICVLVGIALTVLPGPLTIPPVVLGLWIWSTEFAWARSIFLTAKRKAQEAWAHARQHPVSSAAITIGGLVAAGVAIWAVGHFQLVDKGINALGL